VGLSLRVASPLGRHTVSVQQRSKRRPGRDG
jgi:hypothetical protein